MKKYEINEELAKRAKSAYSFSDYVENSATNSYYELLSTFDNAVNELIKKIQKNLIQQRLNKWNLSSITKISML